MTYPLPSWVDEPSMLTALDSANFLLYNNAINGITATIAGLQVFIPFTAVQTAASITASANTFVLISTNSNNVTMNFPVAPPNGTIVGAKQVVRGGTNTVTMQLGGSDHFDTTTGSQSGTLTLLNQSGLWQYNAATAVYVKISDNLSLSQLDLRYVNSVTNGDSTITMGGTTVAPTVKVAQSALTLTQSQITGLSTALNLNYSAGAQWGPNVYGTLFENLERDDVTTSIAMTGTTHTFLVLLGWVPAATYAKFWLYVTASAASVTLTAALYSASTLTNTSWSRLGSGNVTPVVSATGLVSTSLAFTLASPAFVVMEMALTSGSNLPAFGGSASLATTGASGFINPASGSPTFGTLNSSSAPGSTLNPTTGFTAGTQKIWCALA